MASTFSTLSTARPASNPRANLAWRAVDGKAESMTVATDVGTELEVDGDGDISMAGDAMDEANAEAGPSRRRSPGSAVPDDEDEEEDGAARRPDVQLLSALHSTSRAMDEISKRSTEQQRAYDPRDELRRIELQMLGASSMPAAPRDRAVSGHARLNAVRGQKGVAMGASPMSSTLGVTPARQAASSPVAGR